MKITNDIITLEPSDFNGLSDFARKAVTAYFGPGVLFNEVLSKLLNDELEKAEAFSSDSVAAQVKLKELSDLLAQATPQEFADAVVQLDQIKVSLGGVPSAQALEVKPEGNAVTRFFSRLFS